MTNFFFEKFQPSLAFRPGLSLPLHPGLLLIRSEDAESVLSFAVLFCVYVFLWPATFLAHYLQRHLTYPSSEAAVSKQDIDAALLTRNAELDRGPQNDL